MEPITETAIHAPLPDADAYLARVQRMIRSCMQCGTCTGSCPNEFAMDFTPRQLWRLVLSGEAEEVFRSKTFALCSACYYCTLRCPRGLPLTEAMFALKQAAHRLRPHEFKPSRDFYHHFMNGVRRRGRVNEMEFMSYFFLARKNPLLPFKFASLGLKLMSRRKVSVALPRFAAAVQLEPIFRKVEAMEREP